jgi:hypothetical protein
VGESGGVRQLARHGEVSDLSGLGPAMGHMPEPVARAAGRGRGAGHVVAGGSALAMNERHMRRVLAQRVRRRASSPMPPWCAAGAGAAYVEYGRYWLDGARLPYHAPAVRARMMFASRGEESGLRAAAAEGRGVVMALPHVGSWEWGGAWLALEGMPMTAVVERPRARAALRMVRGDQRAPWG